MSEGWSVLSGLIVTILTYFFTQWEIKGKWAPIGTAIKGIIALVVCFILSIIQGLVLKTFSIQQIWAQMPIIVSTALAFYGIIVKPIDKAINPTITIPVPPAPPTTTETTPPTS